MQIDYCRFLRAKSQGTLKELVDGDTALLAHFNLQASGFEPGVMAVDSSGKYTFSFNTQEWEWLRPLLEELRDHRANGDSPTTIGIPTTQGENSET